MPQLVHYLTSLPDLAKRSQLGMRSVDFTLERMQALMAVLGSPQQAYPSIHVAGTNGKGSVCTLCAEVLRAQGYRVGLFTSPHVRSALDGILINGQVVHPADLQQTFERLYPVLETEQSFTHFEVLTALMFLHFARSKVDLAVIEVGLGGRLDATNVLLPLVSVITPVDYDHTAILGTTLTEIAKHKAGIIKPGVPVVIAPQAGEAKTALLAEAELQAAPVIEIGKDVIFERTAFDLIGQDVRIRRIGGQPEALHIRMLGLPQAQNAAVAFAALQVANERGVKVSLEAIRAGFEAANWPGRFEILQKDPPLILDAAHSAGAAAELRRSLDEFFLGQRVVLVLGVSADKNLDSLLAPLIPIVSNSFATQSPHARAMPAGDLAARMAKLGLPAMAMEDPLAAVRAALATDNGQPVLVAGSVFLVEHVGNQLGGR